MATANGGAIYSVRQPGSQTVKAATHLIAVMLAPAPGNKAALGGGKLIDYDAEAGAIVVQPADIEARAVWSHPRESMIVAIRPESLRELAANALDISDVSLRPPPFGTVDGEGLRMAQLLKLELTRPYPPNELYVDGLVVLFGLHLLRNYSDAKKLSSTDGDSLSRRDIKRVRAFLHENFSRKLSVAELAAIVDRSQFHFIRAFGKAFGQSPHQYVLGLRLAFAEKLLTEGNLPITEIAHLSGFSSQSHLTTVMRKQRNVTPAQLRNRS